MSTIRSSYQASNQSTTEQAVPALVRSAANHLSAHPNHPIKRGTLRIKIDSNRWRFLIFIKVLKVLFYRPKTRGKPRPGDTLLVWFFFLVLFSWFG